MIIPEGFYVSRCGTEIKHIGYKPAPAPGRSGYKPFTKPDKIFSAPTRWIFIEPVDPSVTIFSARKIWDDGSVEFAQAYAKVTR